MPTGTKWNSTVSIAPVQIYTDTIGAVFISGTVTVNVVSGATVAALDCSDVGSAQRMVEQVNSTVKSGSGVAAPVVVADTPTPAVPTGLATVASGADIAATWNVASAATGYILLRSSNGTDYSQVYNGSTNSFTDTGNSTNSYYYKVLAYTPAAQSALSSAVQYTMGALIPVMTGNTAPSGTASASWDGSNAFHAFDGNDATVWGNVTGDNWVQYQFAVAVAAVLWRVVTLASGSSWTITLQGSNDGSNWTAIDSFITTIGIDTARPFGSVSFSYWRFNYSGVGGSSNNFVTAQIFS
jgi:hypothetical protein